MPWVTGTFRFVFQPMSIKLNYIPADPKELHDQGKKKKDLGAACFSVTMEVRHSDGLDLGGNWQVIGLIYSSLRRQWVRPTTGVPDMMLSLSGRRCCIMIIIPPYVTAKISKTSSEMF